MKRQLYFCTLWFALLFSNSLSGQSLAERPLLVVDDIQIDVKSVHVDAQRDTLSVALFLISYQKDLREFKLNTFATQLLDSEGNKHLFSTIKMGRVEIRHTDRQNYLHYLLEEDVPVLLTIQVANWEEKKASRVLLVFEDSKEEGRFLTRTIDL